MSSVLLSVELAGRRVVGVGAGPVAWRKYRPLLEAGADLVVVAPAACDAVVQAAEAGELGWDQREYRPGDAEGVALVVAGTSDAGVNDQVAAEASARGSFCVRIDGGGSAAMVAAVRRGPVTLGVSTSGQAPALARHLRQELEAQYGAEYGELAALMGELRRDPGIATLLSGLSESERALRWHAVLASDTLRLLRSGYPDKAKEAALQCLSSSAD